MLSSLRGGVRRIARGTDGSLDEEARRGQQALDLVKAFEEQGPGWFWQTDRDGRITYLSDKVAKLVSAGEALGRPFANLFQVDGGNAETERTLRFHLSARTSFSDYSVRSAQSDERWWSISGRPVLDRNGNFQGFIGHGSDLSEKRRAEAEITRLALFDSLTGLANRQRMRQSLEQMLAQAATSYRQISLLLLDLDRFKAVNDTLGHQTGDGLLQQVAQRLHRAVGENGLVGRLGGDEFKVVLGNEANRQRLTELANRIIADLSQPYFVEGASISIGVSIGIAVAPDDGDTSETLVRNADLALYAAKADGRGTHRFYAKEMLAEAQGRKQLEDNLRQALASGQFHLVYQPVVTTTDARITGYEALLRWEHPQRGPISPAEFIPIAEDCGLIDSIGEWVLRTAVADAANWPDGVRVAVNVSPIQFANPALPAIVASALASSGLEPARLELEITESVFLDENASSDRMFASLKGLGVRLALDDFGTGYSSLGYLRNAPFDKIKIDQSFVRGAALRGNRNAAIIRAIVTLADTLGMETTAEGVETQDEIDLMRALGCSHIQGFVYGGAVASIEAGAKASSDGGSAIAQGFRTSRLPRLRTLRWATLHIGAARREVRVRNLSATGAMIDGIELPLSSLGSMVQIELGDGRLIGSAIRWAAGNRAGLEFTQAIAPDSLAASAPVQI